uniref:Protein kinase domain-containing protein n=2 Tax=Macrostomum lignano TaxID=282301 RepID=A0A1I8JI53_9PLAT
MGSCCCKTLLEEIGEADRLLQSPVSNEPYGFRTSRAGTWDPTAANGNGLGAFGSYGERAGPDEDLNMALAQILDSVSVQVIDVAAVADVANRPLDSSELAKRSHALLTAARERLESPSSSNSDIRRSLPVSGASGGGLQLLLIDDADVSGGGAARRATVPRPDDLRLSADTSARAAVAVADIGVSPPEDLLAAMGPNASGAGASGAGASGAGASGWRSGAGALVLAPLVLAPLVLAPLVLAPLVLAPLVLAPLVLAPLVLAPLVLASGAGASATGASGSKNFDPYQKSPAWPMSSGLKEPRDMRQPISVGLVQSTDMRQPISVGLVQSTDMRQPISIGLVQSTDMRQPISNRGQKRHRSPEPAQIQQRNDYQLGVDKVEVQDGFSWWTCLQLDLSLDNSRPHACIQTKLASAYGLNWANFRLEVVAEPPAISQRPPSTLENGGCCCCCWTTEPPSPPVAAELMPSASPLRPGLDCRSSVAVAAAAAAEEFEFEAIWYSGVLTSLRRELHRLEAAAFPGRGSFRHRRCRGGLGSQHPPVPPTLTASYVVGSVDAATCWSPTAGPEQHQRHRGRRGQQQQQRGTAGPAVELLACGVDVVVVSVWRRYAKENSDSAEPGRAAAVPGLQGGLEAGAGRSERPRDDHRAAAAVNADGIGGQGSQAVDNLGVLPDVVVHRLDLQQSPAGLLVFVLHFNGDGRRAGQPASAGVARDAAVDGSHAEDVAWPRLAAELARPAVELEAPLRLQRLVAGRDDYVIDGSGRQTALVVGVECSHGANLATNQRILHHSEAVVGLLKLRSIVVQIVDCDEHASVGWPIPTPTCAAAPRGPWPPGEQLASLSVQMKGVRISRRLQRVGDARVLALVLVVSFDYADPVVLWRGVFSGRWNWNTGFWKRGGLSFRSETRNRTTAVPLRPPPSRQTMISWTLPVKRSLGAEHKAAALMAGEVPRRQRRGQVVAEDKSTAAAALRVFNTAAQAGQMGIAVLDLHPSHRNIDLAAPVRQLVGIQLVLQLHQTGPVRLIGNIKMSDFSKTGVSSLMSNTSTVMDRVPVRCGRPLSTARRRSEALFVFSTTGLLLLFSSANENSSSSDSRRSHGSESRQHGLTYRWISGSRQRLSRSTRTERRSTMVDPAGVSSLMLIGAVTCAALLVASSSDRETKASRSWLSFIWELAWSGHLC